MCGLSCDPDRFRGPGGGGKTGFAEGSGDDLYWFAGEDRAAGEMPVEGSSACINDARLLRGGEYGGGAGTTTRED